MDWPSLLSNWGPLLLLIGVWIFFMLRLGRKDGPAQQSLAEMRRHNEALEKLLASHETRLQKLEDGRGGG
jgi:hypothetical protein